MKRIVLLAAILAVFPTALAAYSSEADEVIALELADACGGDGGTIDPGMAIERDLTGDGNPDLLVSHEGIACSGPSSRSGFCGAALCSVNIYVRRGPAFEIAAEMLGLAVSVGEGSVPAIQMYGIGGRPVEVKWDGQGFR